MVTAGVRNLYGETLNLYMRPIGDVDDRTLRELKASLSSIFKVNVIIDRTMDIPDIAYNPKRNQYNSSLILNEMMKSLPQDASKVLGIIDVDLFVPRLNFVFGEARDSVAVISITRLRQEYYGLSGDDLLFGERVLKEAVHEVGHMYGLGHCTDRLCVMHFSNCLDDTDIKDYHFCSTCGAFK